MPVSPARSLTRRAALCGAVAQATAMACPAAAQTPPLQPHRLVTAAGRAFTLNLPPGFGIRIVAEGMRRARFFATSPDRRVFVTDLHSLFDTRQGTVFVLDGLDPEKGPAVRATPFATGLRNPNSVAFHTDTDGGHWFYMALTDRLVRYRYEPGDMAPRGAPATLATFPDYGLDYRYGGWHLTRTIAFGPDGTLYVSAGSSCNACIEKEEIRASVMRMNADGSDARIIARGLRNAVGLRWIGDRLVATNMGADHLGTDRPDDTMFAIEPGRDYGWPHCWHNKAEARPDPKFPRTAGCRNVPRPLAVFPAHSSPLGFAFFGASGAGDFRHVDPRLQDVFLVALQGAFQERLRRGYKVVRIDAAGRQSDFVSGFMAADGTVHGRPCDILPVGPDRFLLSDDKAGLVYAVFPTR